MNDAIDKLTIQTLKASTDGLTRDDLDGAAKTLNKYLEFVEDDEDAREKSDAVIEFFVFIVTKSVALITLEELEKRSEEA